MVIELSYATKLDFSLTLLDQKLNSSFDHFLGSNNFIFYITKNFKIAQTLLSHFCRVYSDELNLMEEKTKRNTTFDIKMANFINKPHTLAEIL